MRRLQSGRGAFTLIELLVVISIIGILAGMLLPALARGRTRATAAQCASNLRQWGIAAAMYFDDAHQLLPLDEYDTCGGCDQPSWPDVMSSSSTYCWYNILPRYFQNLPFSGYHTFNGFNYLYKTKNILQCPAVNWLGMPSPTLRPYFSYAYNSKLNQTLPAANLNQVDQGSGGANNGNHRLVDSTTVVMFLDTMALPNEPKAFAGEGTKYGSPKSYTSRISARHGDFCNICFFDGHVEPVHLAQLMDSSGKNIKTSPVIWDPLNPDAP